MSLSSEAKEALKKEIVTGLSAFSEVRRIVIFGSFLTSDDPRDLDIAVFQDTDADYYSLAMKYRRTLRPVAKRIPIDVIPIRKHPESGPFLDEIRKGEVLYET